MLGKGGGGWGGWRKGEIVRNEVRFSLVPLDISSKFAKSSSVSAMRGVGRGRLNPHQGAGTQITQMKFSVVHEWILCLLSKRPGSLD